MSSAETLNFGPQWLRELSSRGNSNSISPSSPSPSASANKYKLAQHRYGREEMLALFQQQQGIPPELTSVPIIISEEPLQPISLIPLKEEDQHAFSGVVNSDVYHRPRGGANPMGRGRSVPSRGRGRGRGDSYMRSASQNDEGDQPYGKGGSREFGRRESWDDRGFGRGRAFDEGASIRKSIRRSDACDDWRSDSIRGSGDGADAEGTENADWKPAPRRDSWRDAPVRSGSNWREAGGTRENRDRDWTEVPFHSRDRKGISRARSLSNKYDGDFGLMPEWANDVEGEEVGVFDSSGTFQSKHLKTGRVTKEKEKPTRSLNVQTSPLKQIKEVKSPIKQEVNKNKQNENQTSPITPTDFVNQKVFDNVENKIEKPPASPEATIENKLEVKRENVEIDTPNLISILPNVAAHTVEPPVNEIAETDDFGIEQAALNLVDSITGNDEEGIWGPDDSHQGFSSFSNLVDRSQNWFYKDPQGETQGPFTNQEMEEWFSAGYFTVNLNIKRDCDSQFITLGELVNLRGPRPFSQIPYVDLATQKHNEMLEQQHKLLALQQKQQQLQLQKQQQQQQQIMQQQQLLRYQQQQQQEAAYQNILSQLSTSEEFLVMNAQQKQTTVLQYMNIIQQRATALPQNKPPPVINASEYTIWDNEMATVRRPSPAPSSQQHITNIIQQKEQQNELQNLEKEPERRKEEQLSREELLRIKDAQEQLNLQQQDEQIRIQQELEIKRKQAEEQRKKVAKEEAEKKANEEERKRKDEESRKMKEEKVRQEMARMKEEARREEEKRKEYEKLKQEENRIRKLEIEAEMQCKLKEEIKRKQAKEKMELEEAEKSQREYELQCVKEEALKKKHQEQLKNIKLPTTSNWAQQRDQPSNHQPQESMAVIQQIEENREREKMEQKREQQQLRYLQQQQNQQKGVWGSSPVVGTKNPLSKSLMEIQLEEARRQKDVVAQKPPPQVKPDILQNAAGAWGNRPSTVWGQQPYQPPIWESPISNSQQFETRKPPKQNKRNNKKSSTKEENSNVLALFKEEKATQGDEFALWCNNKIKNIPAAKDLDIPTFVGFLREVESAYDVKDYVTSYLGDSKLAATFSDDFLQQRSLLKQQMKEQQQLKKEKAKQLQQQKQTQKKQGKKPQQTVTGWNQETASETSEVVTGSTKRGKRKQKKLQKVDPSILGFSVNAASDRVNMGQIETPEG